MFLVRCVVIKAMKNILFIATGGTISCAPTEKGLAPSLGAEQIIELVPQAPKLCRISAVQPFRLDSTNMSPREWTELARLIKTEYARYDGFVIAHGTDTMAYAAAALSCLVQNSEKPIVLTGSQLPMTAEDTDAKDNLLSAFAYAASGGAWGVRLAFCGRIIDGRCAYKRDTKSPDAFMSVNRADSGAVNSRGEVAISHPAHKGETRFYDRMDSRVATVKLTPGAPACTLEVQGVRAAIIEGYGAGGLPDYGGGEYAAALGRLADRGVYLIFSTQALLGGTQLSRYEVGSNYRGRFMEAGEMTAELAAMKAMWALAYSQDIDEFERLYAADI